MLCAHVVCPAGPAKKHLLIHMDASGQPHQHHDYLVSPKAASHSSRQHHHQERQRQPGGKGAGPDQRQQPALKGPAASAASAAAAPQAVAAPAPASAQSFAEATEMQLEEMEALEAIFSSEYSLVSSCPPTFVIKLREPGSEEADETQQAPPSAHFGLRFKLPIVSLVEGCRRAQSALAVLQQVQVCTCRAGLQFTVF